MKKYRNTKNLSGFTLIEMIIVLSIFSTFVVGAFGLSYFLRNNTKSSDFLFRLGKINSDTRTEVGAMYDRVTTENMNALGIIPDDWQATSTTATHPMGGSLTMEPNGGPPASAWMVSVTNIDPKLCLTIFSNYTILETTQSIQIGTTEKWKKADGQQTPLSFNAFCGTADTRTMRLITR